MEFIKEVVKEALLLIISLDKEVIKAVILSLKVSSCACILATLIALPISIFISLRNFFGKRIIITFINTFLFFPAVVIGLLVYVLFSKRSILGAIDLLYTPYAMILAQTILATPIICALSIAALKGVKEELKELALTLGANKLQLIITIIKEVRYQLLAAIIMGFARIIGETGMTLMVGGNIKSYTRVMTTTIALETLKGNFELGIALGIILLLIALIVNIFLQILQGA